MTLTAVGFTGTVDEVEWAKLTRFNGVDYDFGSLGDFEVQPVAGLDRTIRVLPGAAFGHGVLVESDANETVQLDTVSSGSRWDTIVLRRTWGTGVVEVIKLNGTSTKAISTSRQANPGVVDDQPLALVQVTAGSTVPTAVEDLRTHPSKVISAGTDLAVPSPDEGTILLTPSDLLVRRDSAWARVLGGLASMVSGATANGGTPPDTSQWQIKPGLVTVTASSTGAFTVPNLPFANGLIVAHAWQNFDQALNNIAPGHIYFRSGAGTTRTTAAFVRVRADGSGWGGTFEVGYVAYGW